MFNSNRRQLIMDCILKEISVGLFLNLSLLNKKWSLICFYSRSFLSAYGFFSTCLLKDALLTLLDNHKGFCWRLSPWNWMYKSRSFGLLVVILFFFSSIRVSHHNKFHSVLLMRKSSILHIFKWKIITIITKEGSCTHTDMENICMSMSGLVTGWQFN